MGAVCGKGRCRAVEHSLSHYLGLPGRPLEVPCQPFPTVWEIFAILCNPVPSCALVSTRETWRSRVRSRAQGRPRRERRGRLETCCTWVCVKRSRSHHGHRSATVTPESLQAAGKLPCATTLSSLDAAVVKRRRRRVTSFAFPSGGAPTGFTTGASLHLDRFPLQRRRPRRRVCRLRRLRPALPASSPMCAETCNWASDANCDDGGPGSGSARRPARADQHVGPDHRLMSLW